MAEDAVGRASVDGIEVVGVDVDAETRCAPYGTDRDVLAIAFRCCVTYFPCFRCHAEVADHVAEVWSVSVREEKCGPRRPGTSAPSSVAPATVGSP